MDNFLNYITKPLNPEHVDRWFRVNNIITEKLELYYDFTVSLYYLINKTYLGGDNENDIKTETQIIMSKEDNQDHFKWCWNKNLENFKKENIIFEDKGEHYDYFMDLFNEIFYDKKTQITKESVDSFFNDMFNREKVYTQVDLDLIYNLYKSLDKNIVL